MMDIMIRHLLISMSLVIPLFILYSKADVTTEDSPSFPAQDGKGKYFQRTYKENNGYEYSFLISEGDQKNKLLETPRFFRGADILISPDSQHIAISWYMGSNLCSPVILKWDHQQGTLNVLHETAEPEDQANDLGYIFWTSFNKNYHLTGIFSHSYTRALAWLDQDTLLLGGRGYDYSEFPFYVDAHWGQLYSLSTGKMSISLKDFNARQEALPTRKVPPHQGEIRGYDQLIVETTDGFSTLKLPNGQELTSKGAIGIIYNRLPKQDSLEQAYLIENILMEDGAGTCHLIQHTDKGEYIDAVPGDLSSSFMKAALWTPSSDDRCTIYALASLDSTHFLIQGYITNSLGQQTGKATLIYDVTSHSFSDDLPQVNDTKPRHFSPRQRH